MLEISWHSIFRKYLSGKRPKISLNYLKLIRVFLAQKIPFLLLFVPKQRKRAQITCTCIYGLMLVCWSTILNLHFHLFPGLREQKLTGVCWLLMSVSILLTMTRFIFHSVGASLMRFFVTPLLVTQELLWFLAFLRMLDHVNTHSIH